jgi:hypothetical protein
VEHFRALDWDNARLHDASPFRIVDPGFNAILIRSASDLADLALTLGETALAAENRAFADRGTAALESLWSESAGQYLCRDRVTGTLIDSRSVGGLLAVFAPIPAQRAARIADTIDRHGHPVPRCRRTRPTTRAFRSSATGADRSGWSSTT